MRIALNYFFVSILLMVSCYTVHADDQVEQQFQGFNLNGYTESGKKSWDVKGDKADISDDQIKITNVNANSFDKQKANLTSKTGIIDKVSGDIHLEKDVVVTSERGTQMTTDSLDWKRGQDLVETEAPVLIKDALGTLSGTGLRAHPNLKSATINQDVSAKIKSAPEKVGEPAQIITITCDGAMEVDQLKMYAVFNDNVVAVEKSTGRELHADRMQVYFDDKNKKIKKLICTGHVEVIQGNNASYADKLVYSGEDQHMTLTGRPKIIFDTGEANGSGMFQKL